MATQADSFLLFSTPTAAQNRSGQMSNQMHCDGVLTKFWYEVLPLTDGRGAMAVRPTGPYGTKPGPTALSQLTPSEISQLQPYSVIAGLLKDPLPPGS
jgi:hypothetical protein